MEKVATVTIISLYLEGMSISRIASRYNTTRYYIQRHLMETGVELRKSCRPITEFTEVEKLDILFRHQVLLQTPPRISRDCGVGEAVIKLLLMKGGHYRDLRKVPAFYDDRRGSRGGVRAERQKLNDTPEYKEFRLVVFRRDNWRCKFCGSKYGLHLHHILPWRDHPDKIMEEDNAVTLCSDCHYPTILNEYEYVERCRAVI